MSKNFNGVIIEESLENKDVLQKVKIIKTKVEKVTEVAFVEIKKKKMHIVIMLPYEIGNNLIKKHKLTQLHESVQNFYNGPFSK